jgi:hypothetical protein
VNAALAVQGRYSAVSTSQEPVATTVWLAEDIDMATLGAVALVLG